MKWNKLPTFFAAGGMLLLILDSKTALESANDAIELCIRSVIPSLFPFFVLSTLMTGTLTGTRILTLRPLCKLLGIPQGAESILLTGFLGGYPVGAGSVAAAYRAGQLHRSEAERMLSFCNNAGPSFLFGMIGCMFSEKWIPWVLWAIHIVSALFVSITIPGGIRNETVIERTNPITLPIALRRSLSSMATVCGWVVIFRVMIGFLDRWILWLLPTWLRVAISGLLELANGCCSLNQIADVGIRFLICSGMLAFGGVCVTMQTATVTAGLSLRQYVQGKLLQTLFSMTLSLAALLLVKGKQYGAYLPLLSAAAALSILSVVFCRKMQKSNSILGVCSV